ncbi:hypothetical protein [Mycolicibacterium sp. P9-64]|uniref:hypothetical protein n=1 Tax=Mycolicibacterium sp. P9-64 TaxID=2024612 RepID=UPI001F5B65E6|nr:hypothetical protein [Mycolicibacterium sp. P9-64]
MSTTSMAPARADEPVLHRVVYTVVSQNPFRADIYHRDSDPPDWAAYSHNPYEFSPRTEFEVGPNRPWVREVTLRDPQRWAMVAVTSGPAAVTPHFQCSLEIDGVVADTASGPKGALCSLRNW